MKYQLVQVVRRSIGASISQEAQLIMGVAKRDCPNKNRAQGVRTSTSASVQQPPTKKRDNQPRQGRAFALVSGNIPATYSIVSGILLICGQLAHVLIDSSSIYSFVLYLFSQYLYVPGTPWLCFISFFALWGFHDL